MSNSINDKYSTKKNTTVKSKNISSAAKQTKRNKKTVKKVYVPLYVYKRKKWMKKHRALLKAGSVVILLSLCLFICLVTKQNSGFISLNNKETSSYNPIKRPNIDVRLLTINDYSRPAIALEKINGIIIHYTANPKSSAIQNRNYFEGLKDLKSTKASSHFVIGLDGEIVQCIPSSEIAYASNDRNYDTLSIECCHPDKSGKFNQKTYDSLVYLTAWLCMEFDVDTDDIIRHYDVTGKLCPKYFVENEDEWEKFLADVDEFLLKYS